MTQFTDIALLGVLASLIIEIITRFFGTDTLGSRVVSLGICIVIGMGYFFLSQTIWWESILGVLAAASAVYAFIFKK